MNFLQLPLLLRCLLVAFAVLYTKKGPELRLLLTNERFGEKKLATKTYDLATKLFWLVASWHLNRKVNSGPGFTVLSDLSVQLVPLWNPKMPANIGHH